MAAKQFSDLIAFDLDGTLVHRVNDTSRGIPPLLLETVQKLSERAHVIVATGRRYRTALPDIQALPKMPFSIVHNGLIIKDGAGATIDRLEMTPDEVMSVIKILEKHSADYFITVDGYEAGVDFVFTEAALKRSPMIQLIDRRAQTTKKILKSMDEIHANFPHPILEVGLLGPYPDLIALRTKIEKELPPKFRATVVKNIGFEQVGAMEIFSRECSKWSAIQKVHQKLKTKRVIAVGDDENDIEMIRFSDVGIVMDHAEPHVKEASLRHVQGPEGLAKFLRELFNL